MRFFADSPDIPDELLVARDEGRVVFFCGAGVSRAKAGLPNFFELAEVVLNALEGTADSDLKALIRATRELEQRTNFSGLLSADRVFGLLERDFETIDVHREVARALASKDDVDLSAHRLLLELARGPDQRTRLVTTNFDLLFEACDSELNSFGPAEFGEARLGEQIDGIFHLHGRVDPQYAGSDRGGFVLSTAEFGGAYIAQGWATKLISQILRRYLVVFIGYTADDPPVQYLLEALSREPGSTSGLYAFQSNSNSAQAERWWQKGVRPILYDGREQHRCLWAALEAWADRARNVDGWYASKIAMAVHGPRGLQPHERGQVKHVVSHPTGARRFANYNPPPSAEWLCAFDPTIRYAVPLRLTGRSEVSDFNPFGEFGFDFDTPPIQSGPDQPKSDSEIPKDAWNCFEVSRLDREERDLARTGHFYGAASNDAVQLTPRLIALADWLSGVIDQPAAVWWAAGISDFHPQVRQRVDAKLSQLNAATSALIRSAWRRVLQAKRGSTFADFEPYRLRKSIETDGWSAGSVHQWILLHKPYVKRDRPYLARYEPPDASSEIGLGDLVSMDVEYSQLETGITLPDEYLRVAVRSWRSLLETSVGLELEINPYALSHLRSLEDDVGEDGFSSSHGLDSYLIYFRNLMVRLIALDATAARAEFLAWWPEEEFLFAKLRVWFAGNAGLLTSEEAGQVVLDLSKPAFWSFWNQRDVLLVISKLWKSLPAVTKDGVIERILEGPVGYDPATPESVQQYGPAILARLRWLQAAGCQFGAPVEAAADALQASISDWQPQYAAEAADAPDSSARWVRPEVDSASLQEIPLGEIVDRSRAMGADRFGRIDRDLFSRLSQARPVLALAAITAKGRSKEHPIEEWTAFLHADARRRETAKGSASKPTKQSERLMRLVAGRLARLPEQPTAAILHPIADWLSSLGADGVSIGPILGPLWKNILNAFASEVSTREREREKKQGWAFEALNSPAGKLAQVLMSEPEKATPDGFDAEWLVRVKDLLDLRGDPHRHALTIFLYNLQWFYGRDPDWTRKHLLSCLDNPEDETAFWDGFLWAGRLPSADLFALLKQKLIALLSQGLTLRHAHLEVPPQIFLAGWARSRAPSTEHWVSDDELRGVLLGAGDAFRSRLLWQLGRWCKGEQGEHLRGLLSTFLTKAWPRQKTVKSESVSARLCELSFISEEVFSQISGLVVQLVSRIGRNELMLHDFVEQHEGILRNQAQRLIQLLSVVLPTDAMDWPYGTELVLGAIEKLNPHFKTDARLQKLRRQWGDK